jgi:hypothetical protein
MRVAGKYTRVAPSPRYRRLVEQYQLMHLHGETHLGIPPEQTFPGQSLPKEAPRIKRLIKLTGARTILDYGAGKGQQYLPLRITDEAERIDYPDIRSFWGVDDIRCYDPGYQPFTQLPTGKFDGVICTDVLEHCPEEDIAWILDELCFRRQVRLRQRGLLPGAKAPAERRQCTLHHQAGEVVGGAA